MRCTDSGIRESLSVPSHYLALLDGNVCLFQHRPDDIERFSRALPVRGADSAEKSLGTQRKFLGLMSEEI